MKLHFSNIRQIGGRTITGTLCNRMVCDGEINVADDASAVTCKLCQRELAAQLRRAA
jgi:hypothetical protein